MNPLKSTSNQAAARATILPATAAEYFRADELEAFSDASSARAQ
jgi:hypothetical protein